MIKVPMKVKLPDDLHVGRVLSETDDHVTVEIGKHSDVDFSLLEEGDQFFTIAFIRNVKGKPKFWRPWRRGDRG